MNGQVVATETTVELEPDSGVVAEVRGKRLQAPRDQRKKHPDDEKM